MESFMLDAELFLQSHTLRHREKSSLFDSHLTKNSVSYTKSNNSYALKCTWMSVKWLLSSYDFNKNRNTPTHVHKNLKF